MGTAKQSRTEPTRLGDVRSSGALVLDFEERIRRRDQHLLSLLDASNDAILIHVGLRYVYANEAALKLLGREREEVIGHSPFELVPPRFRLLLADRIMEAYTTHSPMPEVEERLLHASGAEVPVEVVTIPIAFEDGVATLVHVRDITARRELEVRLRAADRLASAALIGREIVHDVKNPLTYALCNLTLLEQRMKELGGMDDDARQLFAMIRESVDRASRVARHATVLTAPPGARPSPVDVHDVLRAAIAFLGPDMQSRANVIEQFGDVPKILGNASRLAQVFLNLLTNAVRSFPQHARGPNDVIVTTTPRGRSLVVVEVRDTGTGIPPELQSAVLEPLLTTKAERAGLGLALCEELVSSEGGELSMESVVGAGTTFRVTLRAARPDELEARGPTHSRSIGKRILVVDDEPRLAQSLKMILGTHHATIATSGHEALQRLHAGETYDLVICDVLMDNIDGIDLHRRIGIEWPSLQRRMIFLTGDAFISRTEEFLARVPNLRVQKPFEADELLDAVDEALATFE